MNFRIPFIASLIFLAACKQSDPPPPPENVERGDLYFSGYWWNIKHSSGNPVGPGPNRFSNDSNIVFLDNRNRLHLRIVERNGLWYSSEVISVKEFGYGRYIFTTESDLTTLDEKAVLGLFTWNNYSFQAQANSEVDIEFARWNNANDSLLLTYSVQPVWFSNPAPYTERSHRPLMPVSALKEPCTHVFHWMPDSVHWESYTGTVYPGGTKLASWSFNRNNPTRRKLEGPLVSDPILIPAPEDSTNARMNLWLLFGQPGAARKEAEVIISRFAHIPD
jgi:hypothetical protein